MTERVYSGWRGVTDHKHSLIAVSYDPMDGYLGCRFHSTDTPYIYAGVPEAKYQTLIHSPYAGSYFRKHIMGAYRCLNEIPPPYQGDESGIAAKRAKQAQKRLDDARMVQPIEMDLFGVPLKSGRGSKRS